MAGDGSGGGAVILDKVAYEFTCEDGPEATWHVYRMRFVEELSAPFQLELDLVTADLDIDTGALLGGAAELTVSRGEHYRPIYGVIADVDYIGFWADHLLVRVRIVPAFALAKQRVNSWIFQDATVQEIVQQVLDKAFKDYKRTVDMSLLTRGTDMRDYCVQYHESDFDFVSRLLEEEGISYHFKHDEGVGHEVLVLTDANDQFIDVENVDGSRIVPIITTRPENAEIESLRNLDFKKSLLPTAVKRLDYDFTTPMFPLSNPSDGVDDRSRVRRLYHHMQRRYIQDDIQMRADDHREAASMLNQVGRGVSNVTGFTAGRVYELERHEIAELEQPWVITRVEHMGICPEEILFAGTETQADESEGPRYENRFECVPLTTPVRPRQLTPKPRVYGPQTAIVSGSEEIEVDEYGRIKVQFHWEEESTYDSTSSCWVRVAQSWAGPSWGFQFIPRIGMEVVVTFLEGNPDRPLVTGCVYNGDNAPPYSLPDNKTQSGIKTNSSIGEGSNELRFEDAAGSEEIYLHAQKNWTIAVDNDKSQTVGHDETLSVGNDRTKTVTGNQKEDVTKNKEIHVGGDHTENIDGNKTETVTKDLSLTVSGNETHSITKNQTETVSGKREKTISKTSKVTVLLKSDEIVGLMKSVKVGGLYSEQVGASRSITAVGAFTVTAGLSGKFQCAKKINIKGQGDVTMESDKAVNISAKKKMALTAKEDITIKGDKKLVVDIKDQITFKCGQASITLKKNGDISIKGKKINIKGTGDVIIKGSNIKNN